MEQYYTDAEERAFISRLPKAMLQDIIVLLLPTALWQISIQLKYVASYLGMTIETLSRIRGNQNKKQVIFYLLFSSKSYSLMLLFFSIV